jgi:hypothetical protein
MENVIWSSSAPQSTPDSNILIVLVIVLVLVLGLELQVGLPDFYWRRSKSEDENEDDHDSGAIATEENPFSSRIDFAVIDRLIEFEFWIDRGKAGRLTYASKQTS